jgi:PAS domain S-box-containing protein
VADAIPHIVWMAKADGSLEYLNRQGTEYTGLTEDTYNRWDTAELVHPDDAARVQDGWDLAVRTEGPFTGVYRIRRTDGEFRRHAFRSAPIRGADGRTTAWIGTGTDIEEQTELEDRLRRAEQATAETVTLLETLQSAAPVGFGFVDREFRIVRINETLAAIGGAPIELQIGRLISEVVPEVWAQVEPACRRALAGEAVLNLDISGKAPSDGAVHHWLVSYYPVRVAEAVIGVGIVVVDITERERSESERTMLAAAMEQSADSVVITDQDARITYVNGAFERLSGYAAKEAIGRNPRFLKSGVQSPTFYEAMWAALAHGLPWVADMTNRRKDGSLYQLNSVITPIRAEDESITGYVNVGHDVSHERELETRTEALTRERELIADTLRGLRPDETLESTAAFICRQVGSLTGVVVAALVTFDAEGIAAPLSYVAPDGGGPGLRFTPARSRYLRDRTEAGPWVEWWKGDPTHPHDDDIRQAGVRAFAYAPVMYGGSAIGLLAVASADNDAVAQLSGQLGAIVDFAVLAGALLGDRIRDRP